MDFGTSCKQLSAQSVDYFHSMLPFMTDVQHLLDSRDDLLLLLDFLVMISQVNKHSFSFSF